MVYKCRCEFCANAKTKYRALKRDNYDWNGSTKTVKTYIRKVKLLFNQ